MASEPEHYIGVSGVGLSEQQVTVESAWERLDPRNEIGRFALLGVKATTKSQLAEQPTKYGQAWFPVGEALKDTIDPTHKRMGRAFVQLFIENPLAIESETKPLLDTVLGRSEQWADGFQFDRLPWMNDPQTGRAVLSYMKQNSEDKPIILQCYSDILQTYPQEHVLSSLRDLASEGLVDHVLFDASEGQGKLMDVDQLSNWAESAKQALPGLGIGVAGGLSASVVTSHLLPLMRRCGEVSWDAEGNLHDNESNDGALNLSATKEYLHASHAAITSLRKDSSPWHATE